MIKKIIFLSFLSIVLLSNCSNKTSNSGNSTISNFDVSKKQKDEGLKLIKQNCYACHSVVTKSHDEIIAPPMVAVKRRYKMSYPNEEEFILAFTNWVMDPKEEEALMRGAVSQFNVMLKQPFIKEEIHIISQYIYNNDIEKPEWFQKHFNKEHSKGKGNGLRRGAGNRNRQF
ncbi:hypothetical protein [Lutibacter flavus]|uniref:Cytochrome c domain-containing protein n=1 Tax=Lutibacter flavus TaxID=691689 RepID=A0A238VPB2_9FLAO|nr:hypothetical protein [Lutibacter flavus]SNR36066.1 hypothetical protein SAMN04488111_0811 [Lutibacter flavus]